MYTRPIKDIIGRDLPGQFEVQNGHLADAIEDVVHFGTHVLTWMPNEAKHGDCQLPPLFMVRHLLSLLDGIALLVRQSSIEPCKLELRGAVETLFQIQYVLETDTDKRALAFFVWHTHDQINKHRRFDVTTPEGQELSDILQTSRLFGSGGLRNEPRLRETVDTLESALKKPHLREAEKEFQRTLAERKRKKQSLHFPWYSLYDGPATIRQLARHVGLSALYETFYQEWSGPTHGTDIFAGKIVLQSGGVPGIIPLRDPTGAQYVTQMAVTFGKDTLVTVIRKMVPEKLPDFQEWFMDHQPSYKLIYEDLPLRVEYR